MAEISLQYVPGTYVFLKEGIKEFKSFYERFGLIEQGSLEELDSRMENGPFVFFTNFQTERFPLPIECIQRGGLDRESIEAALDKNIQQNYSLLQEDERIFAEESMNWIRDQKENETKKDKTRRIEKLERM